MEMDASDCSQDELKAAEEIYERLAHGCHYPEGVKMMPGEVEQYLRNMTQMVGMFHRRNDMKYCCMEEYVLKCGRLMGARSTLSDNFPKGRPKECFPNCYRMMRKNLVYCEGYAAGIIPVLHAWLVDREGNVIDPTWASGTEYFGVEFPSEYVISTVLARGQYGVIDNFQYKWPLLRGEEPA